MISEAIQKLTDLSRESLHADRAAYFPKLPDLPAGKLAKVDRAGKLEILDLDPPPRKHRLRSISEIAPFIEYAINTLEATPSIWINDGQIQILIDDHPGERLDQSAIIGLDHTPQFAALADWETEPEEFEHRDFLRMLRRMFSESIPNFQALLRTLRTLKFENGVALTSTAERQRESVGKEIASAVKADAGELPELLMLSVKVYDDAALTTSVIVPAMLDITPAGQFRLIPLAGTTLRGIDATLDAIRSKFIEADGSGVPVFFGAP